MDTFVGISAGVVKIIDYNNIIELSLLKNDWSLFGKMKCTQTINRTIRKRQKWYLFPDMNHLPISISCQIGTTAI